MKPGLTFSNWYIRLTCSTLIGLVVFCIVSNSNNSSVNKASSVAFKSEGILEISSNGKPPLVETIRGNIHTSIPHNENSSDGSTGNAGAESTTTPINQSETLSSNFAGSDVQAKRNESEVLLYRKRRYLLFPEGSSFQLVYDLIIPIVDYTNYAIMGVTVAVAWELPSKPPSEIEEEIRDKLNDGTLGLQRNDSIDNIQYIDTKPLNQHISNIIYVQPAEYGHRVAYTQPQTSAKGGYRPVFKSDRNKPNYYTVPNAEYKLKSINNRRVDPGATYRDPVYVQRQPVRVSYKDQLPEQQPQTPPRPKQHAVYHIMGKRSVAAEHTDPHLEKLDRIHLRYHRSSRLALYPKLEAMFNRQGFNGTECILRALCEVGSRKHETEPGGLLTEIIRTVFTLPKVDDERQRNKGSHPKHNAWDEAYSATVSNCADAYPTCENLLWKW